MRRRHGSINFYLNTMFEFMYLKCLLVYSKLIQNFLLFMNKKETFFLISFGSDNNVDSL